MYRHLNAEYIISTSVTLGNRIRERFPDASLVRVSEELLEVARESSVRVKRLRRPRWLLRIAVLLVVLGIGALMAATAYSVRGSLQVGALEITSLLQGLDAGVNEIILLSIALFFLFSLEGRFKRRQALRALHQLRSIAHVIDMHQLTKDPDVLLAAVKATPSSPQRTMTRFELSRYLDYCSELLSLVSKLAAIHVQYLPDPVVLNAVNDVETLAGGLSQKIWQKIMLLDAGAAQAREKAAGQPG
jgi:hypothetical protein